MEREIVKFKMIVIDYLGIIQVSVEHCRV